MSYSAEDISGQDITMHREGRAERHQIKDTMEQVPRRAFRAISSRHALNGRTFFAQVPLTYGVLPRLVNNRVSSFVQHRHADPGPADCLHVHPFGARI